MLSADFPSLPAPPMFTTLDWVLIVIYMAVVLFLGLCLTGRAGRSLEEYFLSGRNLPWWLAGTSLVATTFSADTPLAVTGWTRSGGIAGNWRWWGYAVSGALVIALFSRLWRRVRVMTDVEFMEVRYGRGPGAFLRGFRAVYNPLLFQACTIAWTLLAGRKLVATIFALPPQYESLVVGALAFSALIYAALSGLWGVVVTDLLQFAVSMVGSITLMIVVLPEVGGLSGLIEATDPQRLAFFPDARAPQGGDLLSVLVFVLVLWVTTPNSDGGGAAIQRFSSSRDERESIRTALWFNVANYALRAWPWILVALASLVVFPDLADPELAYPLMMKRYLPPGLLGLTVVSLIAAFMSTVDTQFNLGAAYFVNDLWRRFLFPGRRDGHYVAVGRLWSVGVMLIAVTIALVADSVRGLFDVFTQIGAGVGSVYLMRWLWWRTNAFSEIAAMIASAGVTGLLNSGLIEGTAAMGVATKLLVGMGVSIPAWVLATLLTPPVAMGTLVAFYERARPPGWWGPVRRAAQGDPDAEPWLRGAALGWAGGVALVVGLTLGVGWLALGRTIAGVGALAVAATGAWSLQSVLRVTGHPDGAVRR
ncbi:MAG: sodium:solute symporter family protein [Planctomycetota bacterium]